MGCDLFGAWIRGTGEIYAVLDAARKAADQSGEWRAWAYLTIQVQLAAERHDFGEMQPKQVVRAESAGIEREDEREWTRAKADQ